MIGATNAMLKFEDIRIVRDMRNSVNRIMTAQQAVDYGLIDGIMKNKKKIK